MALTSCMCHNTWPSLGGTRNAIQTSIQNDLCLDICRNDVRDAGEVVPSWTHEVRQTATRVKAPV
jgi:hypothetical protein